MRLRGSLTSRTHPLQAFSGAASAKLDANVDVRTAAVVCARVDLGSFSLLVATRAKEVCALARFARNRQRFLRERAIFKLSEKQCSESDQHTHLLPTDSASHGSRDSAAVTGCALLREGSQLVAKPHRCHGKALAHSAPWTCSALEAAPGDVGAPSPLNHICAAVGLSRLLSSFRRVTKCRGGAAVPTANYLSSMDISLLLPTMTTLSSLPCLC